jgi:Polysaccharide pyruvyl transferase
MKHVMLRARKGPFEVADAEETFVRNLIADNSGNLIFSFAAHRILETATTTVHPDHFRTDAADADAINERYDAYVVPLANAFRPSFEPALIKLTKLIRRLRIPVIVLGVGAQSGRRLDFARLAPIEPSVRDFVEAVLDRGPSIGVRGELTHDYLRGLGYTDVEVIGCPSLFIHGPDLRVTKRQPSLDRDARLVLTVSPYVKATGPLTAHHVARYPNLTYVAQDADTFETLLWGTAADVDPDDPRPIHPDHPLFREDRVRLFLDPPTWFDYLRGVDFAFGTRIHGTIAALIAGTPAVVLTHDSRTLELARYFDIPHRLVTELAPDTDAADLYADADFGAFHAGHPARLATFVAFLERHGLEHILRDPPPSPTFDERVAATVYPPPVSAASRVAPAGLGGAVKRLRRGVRRSKRHRWVHRARIRLARGIVVRDPGRESPPAD